MSKHYDVLIVGGGIAGVSLGYALAPSRSVALIEMEPGLAHHATGRSAATFITAMGSKPIRALTSASREFFENPPKGFETPLAKPLGMLCVATDGQGPVLREAHAELVGEVNDLTLLDADEAQALNPLLRDGYVELGMLEPRAMELDVHAIHQGYTRGFRQSGGQVHLDAKLISAAYSSGRWRVRLSDGEECSAPILVNAAGAWVDEVATAAGVNPVGIQPLRRTMFTLGAPTNIALDDVPLTADLSSTFYLKPDGEQLLCSPSDEGLQVPGDAQPDELEIARCLDAVSEIFRLETRHVRSSWAGLRSFVADRVPVVGFDEKHEGFFWFAGQGGFGIQTAPALSTAAFALFDDREWGKELTEWGVRPDILAPRQ
jgi:D-arginine dehydrogenase